MTALDRARRYLAKCPPAITGQNGHSTAFAVVCEIVNGFDLDESQASDLLQSWNATCQPPWNKKELHHKIQQALITPHKKPRGYKLTAGEPRPSMVLSPSPTHKSYTAPKQQAPAYNVVESEIPEEVSDGARLLLRTAFASGEGVRITPACWSDEKNGEVPDGGGITLTREEWLRKLDAVKGNPNSIFSSTKKTGIYIAVNPYKVGATKDADVTAFRHALLEFDAASGLSPEAQYDLYTKSRIPCTALIFSGGESLHAWVKIDAQTRTEYDERVKLLYDHFEGYKPDTQNKNPGRLSRLPFCVRFDKRQQLIALDVGCKSFSEWQSEIQAEGIGEIITVEQLDNYDTTNDKNCILGNRWLCRAGSLIIIGPSGIGKSSFVLQLTMPWCIGFKSFGIIPVKPLKVLFIQAENDDGDMSEMLRGIREGLQIDQFKTEKEYELLKQNLIFVRDTSHTGLEFTIAAHRLIDKFRPDLVVFDPLLSFIGADISRQEVCSQFLRNWLNPIATATGVCWICVHHTGKPSTDQKSKKNWKGTDFAYSGLGSSELTNWTRAAITIEETAEGPFRVRFSKRGKRAGATNLSGEPTTTLWLKHAEKGIFWEQIEAPEQKQSEHKGGKPSIVNEIAGSNLFDFCIKCTAEGEGLNAIAHRLEAWLAANSKDVSEKTCKRIIARLVECKKLTKTEAGLYVKGSNA